MSMCMFLDMDRDEIKESITHLLVTGMLLSQALHDRVVGVAILVVGVCAGDYIPLSCE